MEERGSRDEGMLSFFNRVWKVRVMSSFEVMVVESTVAHMNAEVRVVLIGSMGGGVSS